MTTQPRCRSCSAPILWARTEYGNLIPLDADPIPDGNIAFVDGVCKVVRRGELFEPVYEGPYFKTHYATCPQAHEHRRSAARK